MNDLKSKNSLTTICHSRFYMLAKAGVSTFVIVLLSFSSWAQKGKSAPSPAKISADSIISILYSALEKFSSEANQGLPDFRSACITLETNVEKTVNAGLNVLIGELNGEYTRAKTTSTSFEIAPVSRIEILNLMSIDEIKSSPDFMKKYQDFLLEAVQKRKPWRDQTLSIVNLESELMKALDNASIEFSKAKSRRNERYQVASFEVEISFSIKRSVDGKLDFSINGVGGNVGGSTARESIHTITVKYGGE